MATRSYARPVCTQLPVAGAELQFQGKNFPGKKNSQLAICYFRNAHQLQLLLFQFSTVQFITMDDSLKMVFHY